MAESVEDHGPILCHLPDTTEKGFLLSGLLNPNIPCTHTGDPQAKPGCFLQMRHFDLSASSVNIGT
jgi:hypothetical protein